MTEYGFQDGGDRWNATVLNFPFFGSLTLGQPVVILYARSLFHVARNMPEATSDY